VKIAPRWTTGAFYGLVVMVLILVIAASVIDIDRYATGVAATDSDGQLVVLIPAALTAEIAPGSSVDLGATKAEVISSSTVVLYPSEVQQRYDVEVSVPSVAVTTSARALASSDEGVRVLVESEPLIVALVPGLKRLFGDDA
jgi:hypothetical protein